MVDYLIKVIVVSDELWGMACPHLSGLHAMEGLCTRQPTAFGDASDIK